MTADKGFELEGEQDSGLEVEEAVSIIEYEIEWEAQAEVDSGLNSNCEFELKGKDDAELEGQHETGMEDEGYDVVRNMQAVQDDSVLEMPDAGVPQDNSQVQVKDEGQGGAGVDIQAGREVAMVEVGMEVVVEAGSETVAMAGSDIQIQHGAGMAVDEAEVEGVRENATSAFTGDDAAADVDAATSHTPSATELATAANEEGYQFSTVELALIAARLSAIAVTGVSLSCAVAAGKLAETATCMAVERVYSSMKVSL
eukprot:jgi/Chrzof1/1182/Cz01g43220.t1